MKKILTPKKLVVPNKKGDFVEHTPRNVSVVDGSGFICPETGKDLTGYDLAKYAATMWPTFNPRSLPNNEGGKRYQLLLDEHDARVSAAQESGE